MKAQRAVCGVEGCGREVRYRNQYYCAEHARKLNNESAKKRRTELKALRAEVKALRSALRRASEVLAEVAVPDSEC
jgi:hypothetical protein